VPQPRHSWRRSPRGPDAGRRNGLLRFCQTAGAWESTRIVNSRVVAHRRRKLAGGRQVCMQARCVTWGSNRHASTDSAARGVDASLSNRVVTDSMPHHGPPDLWAIGFVVRTVAAGADSAAPAHALRAFILRVTWLTLSLAAAVNDFLTLPIALAGRQSAARCSASEGGIVIARAGNTARWGCAGGMRKKIEYAPQMTMAVISTPYTVSRGFGIRSVTCSGIAYSQRASWAPGSARGQRASGDAWIAPDTPVMEHLEARSGHVPGDAGRAALDRAHLGHGRPPNPTGSTNAGAPKSTIRAWDALKYRVQNCCSCWSSC